MNSNLKKTLKNYLDKINIYGINIPLRYHKNISYSSSFGIILSIITILYILTTIIRYSIILFNHSNFSIITNSLPVYPPVNLSEIPIMIGLIDIEGHFYSINESIFTISIKEISKKPSYNDNHHFNGWNSTTNEIKIEKCDENIHFYKYKNHFSNYSKDNFLCIKPNQNITIRGQVGETRTGYETIRIDIILCNKSNEEKKCGNDKEINRELNNKFLTLIYLSMSPDHLNFTHLVRTVTKTNIFYLSKKFPKEYLYFFIPSVYTTTNGIIFSKKKVINFADFSHIELDFLNANSISNDNVNNIFSLFFTCTEYNKKYYRKYLNISEVFSLIGGIIQIFKIIFQTISDYFGEKMFIKKINNDLILNENKFKSKNKISTFKKKIVMKSENFIDLSSIKKLKTFENHKINIKYLNMKKCSNNSKNFDMENSFSIMNSLKIEIPFIGYILPFFILKKIKRFSILNLYTNFIYSYLSVEKILPIMNEIYLFLLKKKYKLILNDCNDC